MSNPSTVLEQIMGDETRRSFIKKGAVATAGTAAATGVASAQDDGDDADGGGLTEGWKALVFVDNFHPNARFAIVSGAVEWTPNYGEVQDNWFSDYNTRMIRWLNTDEVVPLFVARDANVGQFDDNLGFVNDVDDDSNQPQLFEMNREFTVFGDSERLLTVNVSPVGEEDEDSILENENWWQEGTDENGGATETQTPGGNTTES